MQQFKKNLPILLLMSGILMQSGAALADHGSLGIGTAAPVITQTAVTLPENMWAGGIVTNFTSLDSTSNDKLLRFAEK